jgi:hypothetical protein
MEATLAQAKRYGEQCANFIDLGMEDDYQRVHQAWQSFRRQFHNISWWTYREVVKAYYLGHYGVALI